MSLQSELVNVSPVVIFEWPHAEKLFDIELEFILTRRMGSVFKGVYAKDELTNIPIERPASYIINSDPRCLPGQHWMAVYTSTQGFTTFFYVFGVPPQTPEICEFLNQRAPWTYTKKVYTSNSHPSACGQYCICFLLEISQLDLMEIVEINSIL